MMTPERILEIINCDIKNKFMFEDVFAWPDDSHKDSDWIRERGPEKIHMKNGSNIILKESEGGEKSFLSCDAHGHNIFIM